MKKTYIVVEGDTIPLEYCTFYADGVLVVWPSNDYSYNDFYSNGEFEYLEVEVEVNPLSRAEIEENQKLQRETVRRKSEEFQKNFRLKFGEIPCIDKAPGSRNIAIIYKLQEEMETGENLVTSEDLRQLPEGFNPDVYKQQLTAIREWQKKYQEALAVYQKLFTNP